MVCALPEARFRDAIQDDEYGDACLRMDRGRKADYVTDVYPGIPVAQYSAQLQPRHRGKIRRRLEAIADGVVPSRSHEG